MGLAECSYSITSIPARAFGRPRGLAETAALISAGEAVTELPNHGAGGVVELGGLRITTGLSEREGDKIGENILAAANLDIVGTFRYAG